MAMFSKILKKESKTIGFVPTMGYLHDGHLSLIKTAKQHMDMAVVSIFVNPIQFSPKEDLDKYPRDLKRDEEMARLAGADVLFHPSADEMYPKGYSTYVNVEGLTNTLCGASRPGHFKGVATVVTKLFGIVKPDIAYFGQKDAQQAAVIKKMAEDLNMDVEIKVLQTIREKDGLAMSSRNIYLSPAERKDALCLNRALSKAEEVVRSGERDARKIVKMMEDIVKEKPTARIDYIEAVDAKTMEPVSAISGETLIALAVFIGKTRLIDNTILKPEGRA
jgi:pantoate--beta-alanine ligase